MDQNCHCLCSLGGSSDVTGVVQKNPDPTPTPQPQSGQQSGEFLGGLEPPKQLMVVTEDFTVKIGPAPEVYDDYFEATADDYGKLLNVTNMTRSPDGSLFCVRDGDLHAGPLPSAKNMDWFNTARRVGKCGWDDFKKIFFHPNGDLYGTTVNGDFYKGPKPDNESVCWRHHVATKIGSGEWNQYAALFFHPNGDLYAVCKDDTLVKGRPPTAPGNWLETTTRLGKNGWLALTHFMAIGPYGRLWTLDKEQGHLYRGSPPGCDVENYLLLAQDMGIDYGIYKFLFLI